MASSTIFPPIVDDYIPATPATKGVAGSVPIIFSMSNYNNIPAGSTLYAHAVVYDQNTGVNIVNKTDSEYNMSSTAGTTQGDVSMRYRSTGVIVNIPIEQVSAEENIYRIWLNNDDLSETQDGYYGWIPGYTYKIQVRLTTAFYDGVQELSVWLNENGNLFSEWSTVTRLKSIGDSAVYKNKDGSYFQITDANFSQVSNTSFNLVGKYTKSTFEFIAEYFNTDTTELLDNYRLRVYKDNVLVDDSGEINIDAYEKANQIDYLFKNEFTSNDYVIKLQLNTINYYSIEYTYNMTFEIAESTFSISPSIAEDATASGSIMENNLAISQIGLENDEGRAAINFTSTEETFTGTFYLRRSDSLSNFKVWEDIAKFEYDNVAVEEIPTYYDYTVESGVWYRYAVQGLVDDVRTQQNKTTKALMRDFEYSYLYGTDGRQLKLKFDNTMNNFNINVNESINNTIGGKFPLISRNGNMYYHSFPLNGLISFQMDENGLFETKDSIYGEDVAEMYNELGIEDRHNVIYERDFRRKVMQFLTDGKPKIFKSPTEGNMIIYVSGTSLSPNQTLGRMIYSFSGSGTEVAEASIEMYKKFGFLEV